MRRATILAGCAVFLGLVGCGSDAAGPTGPAAPAQPLKAELTDPSTSSSQTRVNEAHVDGSGGNRASGCELVTASEARAILGAEIAKPISGPQGHTCIYRVARPAADADPRDGFITVAVRDVGMSSARRGLADTSKVSVGGRDGYCGQRGEDVLLVELGATKVLNLTGPCAVSRQFAARALKRLS